MKFDIALRQNCDQSVTVCWSIQSSAQHWRVEEWRLTWEKSVDSNRANLNDKRHSPQMVGKKIFFVTGVQDNQHCTQL